jgi:hypothetical protein
MKVRQTANPTQERRMFLEQARLDLDSPQGKMAFNGMNVGWPNNLTRIEPLLSVPASA